jgi:hypothetical protein
MCPLIRGKFTNGNGGGEKGVGENNGSQWKQKDHSSKISNLCQVSTSFGGDPHHMMWVLSDQPSPINDLPEVCLAA